MPLFLQFAVHENGWFLQVQQPYVSCLPTRLATYIVLFDLKMQHRLKTDRVLYIHNPGEGAVCFTLSRRNPQVASPSAVSDRLLPWERSAPGGCGAARGAGWATGVPERSHALPRSGQVCPPPRPLLSGGPGRGGAHDARRSPAGETPRAEGSWPPPPTGPQQSEGQARPARQRLGCGPGPAWLRRPLDARAPPGTRALLARWAAPGAPGQAARPPGDGARNRGFPISGKCQSPRLRQGRERGRPRRGGGVLIALAFFLTALLPNDIYLTVFDSS